MKPKTLFNFFSIALCFLVSISISQGQSASTKSEAPAPRAKSGGKLLTVAPKTASNAKPELPMTPYDRRG